MSGETLLGSIAAGDRSVGRDVSATVEGRSRAAIVAVAPLVFLVAFVAHPYIGLGPLPDEAAIASAAAANPFRWGIAHLIAAVASALLMLAFVALRSYLRDAGEDRWSARALPFLIVGGALYAVLPGMEFAVLAAAETGGDPRAAQAWIEPWFLPVIMASGVTWAIGMVFFARSVASAGPVALGVPRFVVFALGAMAVARIAPVTLVQFYVQAAVTLIALLPLALAMWRHPRPIHADRV